MAKRKSNATKSKGKTRARKYDSKSGKPVSRKHAGGIKAKTRATPKNDKSRNTKKRTRKTPARETELEALDEMLLNVLSQKRKKRRKKIARAKDEGWYDDFIDENGDFVDDEDDY